MEGDAGPNGIQDSARGAAVVGVAVGVGVGEGLVVGDLVGDLVGDGVGVRVGDGVGVLVGDVVGAVVGGVVGAVDGAEVEEVGSSDGDDGSAELSDGSGAVLSVPDPGVGLSLVLVSGLPDTGPDGVGPGEDDSVARVTGTSRSLGSPQHASVAARVDVSATAPMRVRRRLRRCRRCVSIGLVGSPDMAPPAMTRCSERRSACLSGCACLAPTARRFGAV